MFLSIFLSLWAHAGDPTLNQWYKLKSGEPAESCVQKVVSAYFAATRVVEKVSVEKKYFNDNLYDALTNKTLADILASNGTHKNVSFHTAVAFKLNGKTYSTSGTVGIDYFVSQDDFTGKKQIECRATLELVNEATTHGDLGMYFTDCYYQHAIDLKPLSKLKAENQVWTRVLNRECSSSVMESFNEVEDQTEIYQDYE